MRRSLTTHLSVSFRTREHWNKRLISFYNTSAIAVLLSYLTEQTISLALQVRFLSQNPLNVMSDDTYAGTHASVVSLSLPARFKSAAQDASKSKFLPSSLFQYPATNTKQVSSLFFSALHCACCAFCLT